MACGKLRLGEFSRGACDTANGCFCMCACACAGSHCDRLADAPAAALQRESSKQLRRRSCCDLAVTQWQYDGMLVCDTCFSSAMMHVKSKAQRKEQSPGKMHQRPLDWSYTMNQALVVRTENCLPPPEGLPGPLSPLGSGGRSCGQHELRQHVRRGCGQEK